MTDQLFTIGSGRNGTKSMATILSTVYRPSFHEYNQLLKERRKTYLQMNFKGPQLRAKIKKYKQFGVFHDSDNCNTAFMHHLCKAFPGAKILLPIGSPISFIRAHRVWGIMGPKDRNSDTRMYPTDGRWKHWPIVVKLAWLWGKRNVEAIKRSDRNRLMVFRTKDIGKNLPNIFKFIDKPLNNRAKKLAQVRHNKLEWDRTEVEKTMKEINQNMAHIEEIVSSFKRTISKWYPRVFK
jgi:hypothetical protein